MQINANVFMVREKRKQREQREQREQNKNTTNPHLLVIPACF